MDRDSFHRNKVGEVITARRRVSPLPTLDEVNGLHIMPFEGAARYGGVEQANVSSTRWRVQGHETRKRTVD